MSKYPTRKFISSESVTKDYATMHMQAPRSEVTSQQRKTSFSKFRVIFSHLTKKTSSKTTNCCWLSFNCNWTASCCLLLGQLNELGLIVKEINQSGSRFWAAGTGFRSFRGH